MSSPTPAPGVLAYTNPDGPDWGDQPPDAYPFIEKARKLATFSSVWLDPNQVDVHVSVTGDIQGAIAKLGPFVPRGVTVYFELAPFTKDQLCDLRDKIFGDREQLNDVGIVLLDGGCGSKDPVVDIGMSPLTDETEAYMRARYPGPVEYHAEGVIALGRTEPPSGESPIAAITDADQSLLVTCGQRPFQRDALDGQPLDLTETSPDVSALREAFDIYETVFGDLSTLPWVRVEGDSYGATFLAPRGDSYLQEMVIAGKSSWAPTTLSECQPAAFALTGGDEWMLDPAFAPPTSTSTELHVLVMELNCASGSTATGRILPPLVQYSDERLTMTVAVRSVGGPATCQGNGATAVTVVLPEPLGDRELAGASELRLFQ
jgi:hypothetical protein